MREREDIKNITEKAVDDKEASELAVPDLVAKEECPKKSSEEMSGIWKRYLMIEIFTLQNYSLSLLLLMRLLVTVILTYDYIGYKQGKAPSELNDYCDTHQVT